MSRSLAQGQQSRFLSAPRPIARPVRRRPCAVVRFPHSVWRAIAPAARHFRDLRRSPARYVTGYHRRVGGAVNRNLLCNGPALRPRHGHRQSHRCRDDAEKDHRFPIRHLPHGAASRFIRWPLPAPSTKWVCTAHTLMCVSPASSRSNDFASWKGRKTDVRQSAIRHALWVFGQGTCNRTYGFARALHGCLLRCRGDRS